MRVYQCDGCKKVIADPYEVKMKEFYVGCEFVLGAAFPTSEKRKTKIDLCEDCFRGLHLIAEKKRGADLGILQR